MPRSFPKPLVPKPKLYASCVTFNRIRDRSRKRIYEAFRIRFSMAAVRQFRLEEYEGCSFGYDEDDREMSIRFYPKVNSQPGVRRLCRSNCNVYVNVTGVFRGSGWPFPLHSTVRKILGDGPDRAVVSMVEPTVGSQHTKVQISLNLERAAYQAASLEGLTTAQYVARCIRRDLEDEYPGIVLEE